MRDIDYNGHVPIGEDDNTTDVCAACRREQSADYRAGYNQALLDVMGRLAQQAHDQLTAALEKLGAV